MPVIINEMELVLTPAPQSSNAATGQQPPAAAPVTPRAILDVVRLQAERMARLKAE